MLIGAPRRPSNDWERRQEGAASTPSRHYPGIFNQRSHQAAGAAAWLVRGRTFELLEREVPPACQARSGGSEAAIGGWLRTACGPYVARPAR
jgi:hypothetical protein